MISLLGARSIDDEQVQSALRASISILRDHQSAAGGIPNNVDCETGRPNFRAYADGGLWWVIGSTLLAPDPATVRTILRWYECQDLDQSGLLQMQESADWQEQTILTSLPVFTDVTTFRVMSSVTIRGVSKVDN